MAQTTSLVFNGGVIPSPSPAPSGSGKAKLLKIGEITVTEQEVQVTKKVICDPDSVTTVAPFMEVLTSARLAELISANTILVLDDGTIQYLMSDANIAVEDGTSVCTAVNFLGLSKENRAKVLYPCTRLTDERTLQQVVEVGEPVETGFDLVKADPEDTEAGTLIDKLEVVDNIRDPDDPPLLHLEVTVDGQGNRKVAINEDVLTKLVDGLPSDEHGYFNSSLYTTPGDGTMTNLVMGDFRISENRDVHGDSIEFVPTHQEGGVDFGEVWLEPGTYILAIQITLQWVGNPRGTFLPLVANVADQPFDFSYEHEDVVRTTRIITRTTRGKLVTNIAIDADTPPMGVWVKNLEVAQIASLNQSNVAHDTTLTGTGKVADPLGVTPAVFGKVKDISTSISQFRNGDVIPVDGPNGPAKMPKDDLLKETAQNALAGNVTPAFDATRTSENPYKAGESVTYEGKIYTFSVDHYGAWSTSDVYRQNIKESMLDPLFNELNQKKLAKKVGKNLFDKDTSYKRYGFYVGYSDGVAHTIADYYVFAIPVVGGDVLSFNKTNINVCALSVWPDLSTLENGKKLIGYISGISTAEQGYTVPAGAVCLVVSIGLTAAETYQIEKGASSTSYEQYKEGVNASDVFGLDSLFEQVDAELANKLDKDRSKNLFNKNTTNKKANSYVNYSTGRISSLSNWSAYVVEIPEGVTKVSISKLGAHSCAFSAIPDLSASSGTIPNYLGGVTGQGNQGWELPAGTVCIIVSCADADADVMQVESGTASTSYVPYAAGLDWSHIINKPSISEAKIRYVGAGQTYSTIQAAMNAAYDGDTIFIMPGVYNESLSNKTKSLRLVGFNRDLCIITYSAEHYSTPPLNIAKGSVENLTFKTTGLPAAGDQGAYCVHVDWDQSINSALQFKNCKFESTSRPCAGIGLRENFTLSFIDCSFKSSGLESPFYCHEQQESNKGNQRVELINCTFENAGNNVNDTCITLQETPSLTGNDAYLLVERCILKRTYGAFDAGHPAVVLHLYGGGTPSGNKYLNSNLWNLDFMSELNNESIVNASAMVTNE